MGFCQIFSRVQNWPSINNANEVNLKRCCRQNPTLKDMVRDMINHSSLLESLREEDLKIVVYILNRAQAKQQQKAQTSCCQVRSLVLCTYMSRDIWQRLGFTGHMRRNQILEQIATTYLGSRKHQNDSNFMILKLDPLQNRGQIYRGC